MRSVGVLPAVALVSGTAVGVQTSIVGHESFIVAACALAVALAAWCARRPRVTMAALLVGFFAAAVVIGADARDRALHTTLRAALDAEYGGFAIDTIDVAGDHDPLLLRAIVTEDAAAGGQVVSVRVRASALRVRGAWIPVDGGVSLGVAGAQIASRVAAWRAGRTIEAPVVFRRPSRYLDDGVADDERDLALSGITLFGSVKSGLLVQTMTRGSVVEEAAADVRAFVRAAVNRWVSSRDPVAGAIVTAVLIGDRTGLPDEVRTRLQAAGTYHVIAISGGNIAILAVIVIAILSVMGGHGRAGALVAIATLIAYALVVAAGASVWRATLMAVLYLAARLVDHRAPPWHAIALAAGVLVVWQPLDVRDAGFILTFGASAALLRGIRLGVRLGRAHPAIGWVAASVAASLATEVALMPVAAHTFSRVTCAGLVVNLVAVPAMAVAQVAGMVLVAVAAVPWLAAPAGWIAWLGAAAIVESARLVEIAPWLAVRVPSPPAWVVVAYYAGLALTLAGAPHVRVAGAIAAAAAGALIVIGVDPLGALSAPPAPLLRMTVFDVGQGDAIAVQSGGDTLLVDTGGSPFGGSFDIGGRVVAPALWARGVRALRMLVVTHGDPDHIGGAVAVVHDFSPRALWLGVPVPGNVPVDTLVADAHARHVPVEYVHAGECAAFGPARIRVLSPPVPDWERRRVRNDDSVVLELTIGAVGLLLTGDIGADVERAIAPQLSHPPVRVLKVAHHGSRTSSSQIFLDAWRPQVAVISVGRGNRFGHPAPDVLERLQATGAHVYRTDRDGAVALDSDGKSVRVTTFMGAATTVVPIAPKDDVLAPPRVQCSGALP